MPLSAERKFQLLKRLDNVRHLEQRAEYIALIDRMIADDHWPGEVEACIAELEQRDQHGTV